MMPSIDEMIGNFVLNFSVGIDKIVKYNHFSIADWIFIFVEDIGFAYNFQDWISNFFW